MVTAVKWGVSSEILELYMKKKNSFFAYDCSLMLGARCLLDSPHRVGSIKKSSPWERSELPKEWDGVVNLKQAVFSVGFKSRWMTS